MRLSVLPSPTWAGGSFPGKVSPSTPQAFFPNIPARWPETGLQAAPAVGKSQQAESGRGHVFSLLFPLEVRTEEGLLHASLLRCPSGQEPGLTRRRRRAEDSLKHRKQPYPSRLGQGDPPWESQRLPGRLQMG